MAYNEINKKSTIKYMKKLKLIPVRFKIDYYENVLNPLIERTGMKPTTYLKVALEEKLHRDFPDEFPVERSNSNNIIPE